MRGISLGRLSDQDVSNQAFPFLSGRVMDLGPVPNAIAVPGLVYR